MNNGGKVVVVLNAPPGAGKDTLANDGTWSMLVGNILLREWQKAHETGAPCYARKEEFKHALVLIAYNAILHTKGADVATEFFDRLYDRERKEQPWSELQGMSPRQFVIYTSENYAKVCLGSDVFGQTAARSVAAAPVHRGAGGSLHMFSDGGFSEEVEIVANTVGAENVYIFQWTAEGCSFKGDSRRYLNARDVPEGVKFIMLPHNMKDGDLAGWKAACLKRVSDYMEAENDRSA